MLARSRGVAAHHDARRRPPLGRAGPSRASPRSCASPGRPVLVPGRRHLVRCCYRRRRRCVDGGVSGRGGCRPRPARSAPALPFGTVGCGERAVGSVAMYPVFGNRPFTSAMVPAGGALRPRLVGVRMRWGWPPFSIRLRDLHVPRALNPPPRSPPGKGVKAIRPRRQPGRLGCVGSRRIVPAPIAPGTASWAGAAPGRGCQAWASRRGVGRAP